jgi:hypothetical protein
MNYQQTLLDYMGAAARKNALQILKLGGYAGADGGTGGPVGGFTGYLPQGRVAFDTTESESSYYPTTVISGETVPSGATLVHNLNRIRKRIADLEAGGNGLEIQEAGVTISSDASVINFASGATVTVTTSGVDVTISGGGGGDPLDPHNTKYGYQALASIDYEGGGEYNTAIGVNSQYSNTTGGENVSLGEESLYSLTEGWDNVAIGYEALYSNTDGGENVAIGSYSMYDNIGGYTNVAIGSGPLDSNTYGSNNVAIGEAVMSYNIEGENNTAVGTRSLYQNVNGDYNIGIGYYAGYGITNGTQNIAIGSESLYKNWCGNYNVAIGERALYNLQPPLYGVIYQMADYSGTVAGTVLATTSGTAPAGSTAGIRMVGKEDDTYDGTYTITKVDINHFYFTHAYSALTSNIDWSLEGQNDYNTAIGDYAGNTVTSGINNTFIGAGADTSLATVTNSIAIGYDATVTQSNQVVLGNSSTTQTLLQGEVVTVATAWDDIRVPVTSLKAAGVKDPGFSMFMNNGGSIGVYCYQFDKASEEELFFTLQMPHSYKLGTDLHPHVHWGVNTVPAGGTTVRWGLEYTMTTISGTFSAPVIVYTDATDPVTRYTHLLGEMTDINGSGLNSVSAMLLGRVFRDVANDNFDNDAALFEIDFHYQMDTLGSKTELSK